jgi:hypothetical protein
LCEKGPQPHPQETLLQSSGSAGLIALVRVTCIACCNESHRTRHTTFVSRPPDPRAPMRRARAEKHKTNAGTYIHTTHDTLSVTLDVSRGHMAHTRARAHAPHSGLFTRKNKNQRKRRWPWAGNARDINEHGARGASDVLVFGLACRAVRARVDRASFGSTRRILTSLCVSAVSPRAWLATTRCHRRRRRHQSPPATTRRAHHQTGR